MLTGLVETLVPMQQITQHVPEDNNVDLSMTFGAKTKMCRSVEIVRGSCPQENISACLQRCFINSFTDINNIRWLSCLSICLSVHICVSSQLPCGQNQAIFSKKLFSVFQRHQHQRYSGSDVKISLCSSYGAADRGSRWCWMPQLLSRLSFPGASSPPYDEESQNTVAALPGKMTARFIRTVQWRDRRQFTQNTDCRTHRSVLSPLFQGYTLFRPRDKGLLIKVYQHVNPDMCLQHVAVLQY